MAEFKKKHEVICVVVDPKTKIKYERRNFLGKGGFAKCYEFENMKSGDVCAGKVVSKAMLIKPHHREKTFQEIEIHRTLSHKHVVAFHTYFEDESNVYIMMELCRKRSLMEMHKRRKTLTVPEVRYFVRQIALACKYMHDNKVIHRDLKLGNLFLNDEMEVKVGDFGLATRISFEGERKKTVCGTPNYIAPEVLTKQGHSYEVDIWSVGCIMYTLLVGTPPFETSNIKNTYSKIKKNEYHVPSNMDFNAKMLIKKLLHSDPAKRPNADDILADDFLVSGYIPSRLPTSCLSMEPRASHNISVCDTSKKLLKEIGNIPEPAKKKAASADVCEKAANEEIPNFMPKDFYLSNLCKMIDTALKLNLDDLYTGQPEDAQDPSAVPFMWISKWVDYTDKYGIGYRLCEGSIGVFFNDITHLILLANGENFQYIDANNKEVYYTMQNYPPEVAKKITILNYFNGYMNENLLAAGESAKPREGDEMTQVPHLRAWFRTKSAIVFHLTNGTVQINFFKDHTKIILCPLMGAVSYIDEEKNFTIYTFKLIEKFGCPPFLTSRLRYAKSMIDKLFKECQINEK